MQTKQIALRGGQLVELSFEPVPYACPACGTVAFWDESLAELGVDRADLPSPFVWHETEQRFVDAELVCWACGYELVGLKWSVSDGA